MDACVLSVDGAEAVRARRAGPPSDASRIAREVTAALLAGGADRLLATREGKVVAHPDHRPLAGRRIVVTRSPEQAAELARKLEELGARCCCCRWCDSRSRRPSRPRSSIKPFARWRSSTGCSLPAPTPCAFSWRAAAHSVAGRQTTLRIAVVGPATRDALEDEGLQAAIAPREFRAQALAEEIAVGSRRAADSDAAQRPGRRRVATPVASGRCYRDRRGGLLERAAGRAGRAGVRGAAARRGRCHHVFQPVGVSPFRRSVRARRAAAAEFARGAGGGRAGDGGDDSRRPACRWRWKRRRRRRRRWSRRWSVISRCPRPEKGGPDVSSRASAAAAPHGSDSQHGARDAAHHARLHLSDVRVPGQRRARGDQLDAGRVPAIAGQGCWKSAGKWSRWAFRR